MDKTLKVWIIAITTLFAFLLAEMLRAEPIISSEDYKKDYSNDYSYSTDSTILYVRYTTIDFLGNETIKDIFCKKFMKVGNVFKYTMIDGSKGFVSPGDFSYRLKINEIRYDKIRESKFIEKIKQN